MNVYQPHLLRSSLETPHVTIIIQDKDTNPKSFLVILREPENVLNFHVYYSFILIMLFAHAHVCYSPMFIVFSVEVVLLLSW